MIAQPGLCATCVYTRRVPHPRGGPGYIFCGRSEFDPAYPKYPRLPVVRCAGYAPRTRDEPKSDSESSAE